MARKKGWRRYRGWIALAVLAAIGLAVFFFVRGSQPPAQATTYQTQQAAKGTLSATVSGSGNLAIRDALEVWPKTAGTVAWVSAVVGKKVSQGATLYKLDPDAADQNTAKALAQKRQAWQQVSQAELAVTQAENQLSTLENQAAKPNSNVSSGKLDEAEQQVTVAKAGRSSAYANYEDAKLAYEDALEAENDLTVKAPYAGTIWDVNISKGDTVQTGGSSSSSSNANAASSSSSSSSSGGSSAPVVIAKGSKLGAELAINEVDISSIKIGQAAQLTFDALPDLTLTGEVDGIDHDGTVSQGVVTYNVWVTLDVTDKRLKTGMSTSAEIVTAIARDVLLVPNAAIKTNTDGSTYVQVLNSGSTTPTNVTVATGLAGDTQTEVKSGLKEGDRVVTQTITPNSTSTSTSSGSNGGGAGLGGGGGFFLGGGAPPGGGK